MNQVTSFVDASFIYGSDVCKLSQLRAGQPGGRLNVTAHPAGRAAKSLMPQETTHPECRAGSGMCFSAGNYLGLIALWKLAAKSCQVINSRVRSPKLVLNVGNFNNDFQNQF
jgi:hypothetical protein